MHGSAHDEAPRQRGVLLRRGRCVQRALRFINTTIRKPNVLAALAVLLLVLLVLFHLLLRPQYITDDVHTPVANLHGASHSTPHVAASPTDRWLLRPDTQHGGSVRVMLLMVSTRVDAQLCYALASAFFADLPIVVLGYAKTTFSTSDKPSLFLDAMQRAGLRDRDVVLLLDSDILFSGEDMLPFIDDYIARSPAAPSALDARAVRAGTARAPSMYAAECNCMAAHLFHDASDCLNAYAQVNDAIAAYVARTGVAYDLHNASVRPLRHLNSGVSIHRVWSARELLRAYVHYIATFRTLLDRDYGWSCDQSVFALFYNDLRAWEVEDDVLRTNSTATAVTAQRGPHGLRAGQLQLEQTGRLSIIGDDATYHGFATALRWRNDATCAPLRSMHYNYLHIPLFVDDVWRRYGRSVRLQQRTLKRAGNTTHTIDLAPPLLSLRPDDHDAGEQKAMHVFPLILHYAGSKKRQYKKSMLMTLPWYVPMRYNATRWQQSRAHLLASFVELWTAATTNTTRRVRYGDVCVPHHPLQARSTRAR